MYTSNVNPLKALCKDPVLSKYFYYNSSLRFAYYKVFKKKLRLPLYAGKLVHSIDTANTILKEALIAPEPYMFGRYGTNELLIATEVLLVQKGIKDSINLENLEKPFLHCGLFPLNNETAVNFANILIESSEYINMYGTFRMLMEDYFIKMFMPKNTILSHMYMMDFFRHKVPFTYAFKGQTVLVIHPYTELIEEQYKNNSQIFSNKYILPDFNLKTLEAVQTIAGNHDERFATWFDALEFMKSQIDKIDFDIALIGCGAYGFPLAAHVKKNGKKAILMGGVTQILFGIKGVRWDHMKETTTLYNENWIRPPHNFQPKNSKSIEDACYW